MFACQKVGEIKRPCFDIYNPIKVTFSHKEKKKKGKTIWENNGAILSHTYGHFCYWTFLSSNLLKILINLRKKFFTQMLNWIHNQQQYKIPISISKKLNPIKSFFFTWQLYILKTSEKQVLCVCKLDWTAEYAGQMQIQHLGYLKYIFVLIITRRKAYISSTYFQSI